MSRDLGRDVPDSEKLYARKLWADFSYPILFQGKTARIQKKERFIRTPPNHYGPSSFLSNLLAMVKFGGGRGGGPNYRFLKLRTSKPLGEPLTRKKAYSALVAQCSATPATVAATPPCSATPFQTQLSVRHLPGMGGERCDTKIFRECGATPLLHLQNAIKSRKSAATRVARHV